MLLVQGWSVSENIEGEGYKFAQVLLDCGFQFLLHSQCGGSAFGLGAVLADGSQVSEAAHLCLVALVLDRAVEFVDSEALLRLAQLLFKSEIFSLHSFQFL